MNPILYRPSSSTPTHTFLNFINDRCALRPPLASYDDLWRWSTDHTADFWDAVWDYTAIVGEKGTSLVVDEHQTPSQNPLWFPNATLNWAQNALQCKSEKIALIQASEHTEELTCLFRILIRLLAEPHPADPSPAFKKCTYNQVYDSTIIAASALLALGVRPGDRVASYASNCIVGSSYHTG